MQSLLDAHELILLEAAVVERLRRAGSAALHPRLVHASLIYEPRGRQALRSIYEQYVSIAHRARLPLMICTPTWRANRERVEEAGISTRINADAVAWMLELREELAATPEHVAVGGLIGCKNDCYRPCEGLDERAAEAFHSWQVDRLAAAGVDFLMAATLPALQEALGIARALARTGSPYLVSFVIGRDGAMLDGTALDAAIFKIDDAVQPRPTGFLVNCAHPTFLKTDRIDPAALGRLIGFQGNASSLDHSQLDGAEALHADDVEDWAERMLALHFRHGVKILGGCCGTSSRHLEAVVRRRPLSS